jgi:hypothetical protein
MQPALANIFRPLINVFEALLKFFHDDIGLGWGLAIAALTVLIRSLLLPLTLKQLRSMYRMAQFTPGDQEAAPTYDEPQMGETAWDGWGQNSDPTESPASCLSGNENVEDLIDVTNVVDTTYGDENFGPVESSTTPGEVTTTGIGSLLASYQGSAFKTIWPTPVVA